MSQSDPSKPLEITLEVEDLDNASSEFVHKYQFRLETIVPADNPRMFVLSGHGIQITLIRTNEPVGHDSNAMELPVLRKNSVEYWVTGRAGMQYRDLIPGRLGGKYIASHIRIAEGGPVPDYVHFHNISFQLIYCCRGWVRVVYEGQGQPFLMHPGDCVLQPPFIRHRVLESAPNTEVVEVTSPAEHETHVDHVMQLPTDGLDTNRQYSNQVFLLSKVDEAEWQKAPEGGFLKRDIGIANATRGLASAIVLRAEPGSDSMIVTCNSEFNFTFVLSGSFELEDDAARLQTLNAGDALTAKKGDFLRLTAHSDDLEILLIRSPA